MNSYFIILTFFLAPSPCLHQICSPVNLWSPQLFEILLSLAAGMSFVRQLQPMSGRCSLFQGIEQLYISPQYTTTCVSIHFLAELIILSVSPQQMLGLPPIWEDDHPWRTLQFTGTPCGSVCHCGFLRIFCVFRIDLVAKGLCLYIISLFIHVLLSVSGIQLRWGSCTLRKPCFFSCCCLFTGFLPVLYSPYSSWALASPWLIFLSVTHLGVLFFGPRYSVDVVFSLWNTVLLRILFLNCSDWNVLPHISP